MPEPSQVTPVPLTETIAHLWRTHADCTWVSDGTNVRWSCGIIHGLAGGGRPWPIHMQPTTRDRHLAALVVTQVVGALSTAFSGDDYEENAIAAIQDGDSTSWFRWLALTTIEPRWPNDRPDLSTPPGSQGAS